MNVWILTNFKHEIIIDWKHTIYRQITQHCCGKVTQLNYKNRVRWSRVHDCQDVIQVFLFSRSIHLETLQKMFKVSLLEINDWTFICGITSTTDSFDRSFWLINDESHIFLWYFKRYLDVCGKEMISINFKNEFLIHPSSKI